ncbi:hypothetical protein ADK47_12310 [Streptomyces rimosus subsp. rimosus]|nr:hypothetical protein ADK42_19560 [Streptomyces rimosus subsp. rimosus]KOT36981.1 hypothetical protein ADK84_18700 [Streptomyces sp. NRRL WC-3701]KOT84862.1 hypothetical protein ADK70_21695 [Streptomyces rimosus subsp. pseudoverticillatus]KOU09515.1 hypothetical protein ADK86_00245 [Streptomyces sp. NRRL F-5755]KOT53823.1 hypothetical protein ADK44_28265 [Streptomyces rimosus subsp. rimosus]
MRPSHDATTATVTAPHAAPVSATPIYDSLYAEYRRSFRALPGDRSGEEGLSAEAMRSIWGRTTTATGHLPSAGHWEPAARQQYHGHPQHAGGPARGHFPPALPPAPREYRPHGH